LKHPLPESDILRRSFDSQRHMCADETISAKSLLQLRCFGNFNRILVKMASRVYGSTTVQRHRVIVLFGRRRRAGSSRGYLHPPPGHVFRHSYSYFIACSTICLSIISIEAALLAIDLLVVGMKTELSNHQPAWNECERPQSEVHVYAPDLAHDLHTR
jgi:hypothetical protein